MQRRAVLLSLLALPFAAGRAAAYGDGPVGDADASEFRRIIEGQIAAFRADDAAGAYAYAAPRVQKKFPDAETFLSMVREGYQPVYRPQSYAFGKAEWSHVGPTQDVTLIGPDGRPWRATYVMQRTPAGEWRILGCILKKIGEDV